MTRMDRMTRKPGTWPWPDTLDAVVAAPGSHRVVFENERTRVLEVMIGTGQREPTHTHRWPSVMLVDRPTSIRSYAGNKLTTPRLSSRRMEKVGATVHAGGLTLCYR